MFAAALRDVVNMPHLIAPSLVSTICFAGHLKLDIPWTNLFSADVDVAVENVYILAGPITDRQYDPERERQLQNAVKRQLLDSIEKTILQDVGKSEHVHIAQWEKNQSDVWVITRHPHSDSSPEAGALSCRNGGGHCLLKICSHEYVGKHLHTDKIWPGTGWVSSIWNIVHIMYISLSVLEHWSYIIYTYMCQWISRKTFTHIKSHLSLVCNIWNIVHIMCLCWNIIWILCLCWNIVHMFLWICRKTFTHIKSHLALDEPLISETLFIIIMCVNMQANISSLHFTFPVTRKDRWGTTDEFATSSLHLFLFSCENIYTHKISPWTLFICVRVYISGKIFTHTKSHLALYQSLICLKCVKCVQKERTPSCPSSHPPLLRTPLRVPGSRICPATHCMCCKRQLRSLGPRRGCSNLSRFTNPPPPHLSSPRWGTMDAEIYPPHPLWW